MEHQFLTIGDFSANKSSELFITFNLSEKIYAMPAENIIEIVQLPALTLLEKAPDYIIGLLNLRGSIVNVIDLSMILGFNRKVYSAECQVLILNANDQKIGIIIDSVKDVIQLEKKFIEPLPYNSKEHLVSGIYKDDAGLIAFLDFGRMAKIVENFEINELDIKNKEHSQSALFPVDQHTTEIFAKRALKLQKELRDVTDSLNYQDDYCISFLLNNEIYCINLKFVREITKLKNVNLTKIPCVPDFIIGIINLRGDFVSIVDIKQFLSIPKTEVTEKTKIIVIRTENIQIGILVDDVIGIENIQSDKLSHNMPSKYEKNNFTLAEVMLNGKVMCIFDLKKFIEDERLIIEDAV